MKPAHFGIFHIEPCRCEEKFFDSLSKPYLDTYIINYSWDEPLCLRAIRMAGEAGKQCFVSITSRVFEFTSVSAMTDVGDDSSGPFHPVAKLKDDWQQQIDALVRSIREAGACKGFAGFYMDEPMLWGISCDQLKSVTKYARETWPDKRFFICFSVAGVAPEFWTNGFAEPITPDAGQYLTDVAYDMYHPFDSSYVSVANHMKERLGNRDDLRIWYIPCTMDYRGNKEEQHCLDHLHGCYELLQKEPCPGGLFCYNWITFPPEEEGLGNVGLDRLTQPSHSKYWPRLMAEIERIGTEIIGKS